MTRSPAAHLRRYGSYARRGEASVAEPDPLLICGYQEPALFRCSQFVLSALGMPLVLSLSASPGRPYIQET